MNLKRLQQSIEKIATYSDAGEGINRLAYTKADQEAKNYLIRQFEDEGLTVRVDTVGNVIARREGLHSELPVVAMGSHIDSVYDAGKYDGVIGVVAALEIIRLLNEESIQTLHPIEVIIFSCEESARFSIATVGSKAMAGVLPAINLHALTDRDGITMAEAFRENQLDLEKVERAVRRPASFKSYVELHIEQGPILEGERLDIGIVSAIAAPTRYRIVISGRASHSGTTPMNDRSDALLGAAEIALEIERAAKAEAHKGTVGTVGVLTIQSGSMNTVPGEAYLEIDIRGTDDSSKHMVIEQLQAVISRVEQERDLQISCTLLSHEQPVHMHPDIVHDFEETCEENNIRYKVMPSGAGHDAMNMAGLCPTGMLFVPSRDGLSHNPKEYTSIEQIGIGTRLLKDFILKSAIVTTNALQNTCLRTI